MKKLSISKVSKKVLFRIPNSYQELAIGLFLYRAFVTWLIHFSFLFQVYLFEPLFQFTIIQLAVHLCNRLDVIWHFFVCDHFGLIIVKNVLLEELLLFRMKTMTTYGRVFSCVGYLGKLFISHFDNFYKIYYCLSI